MPHSPRAQYRCSFCGKHQEQVHRSIAGPGGVYICDECIELCQGIIAEEQKGLRPSTVIEVRIRVDNLDRLVSEVEMDIPPDSPLFGPNASPEAWDKVIALLTNVIRELPSDE